MFSLITFVGAAALVGGSVGYFTFPLGLSMGIKSAINLAENGMVYPMYMDPPFPTMSMFHLYAIKNPREVLRGGKMSFEVKGPYKYHAYLVRDNITFLKGGEVVRYDTGRKLVPLPDQSADFDERMWLINPIVPSTARTVRSLVLDRVPFPSLAEPIVFNSVNLLLNQYKERLMMRTSPREILDGRKVQLLESVASLATRFGLASLIPPGPPQNTFGLAFVQNHTFDRIDVWTGTGQSKDKFAEVSRWKGKPTLEAWRGKCNSIAGTNGELYKPFIKEGNNIRVFLGPLCRSFLMKPTGAKSVMTKSGIQAYPYEIDTGLYKGVRSNPDNKCFCESTRAFDCQYDGLLTMGPCFFDAPLFFSRANFKDVDNRIKRLVDSKSIERAALPDQQTFALEPITGTVLEVNLTLMALFKVVRQPYMQDLSRVQNLTYAPLFATTESVTLDYKYVWQIYYLQIFNQYYKPIMAGMAASGLGTVAVKLLLC